MRGAKFAYEKKIANGSKKNPKPFYTYINNSRKIKSKVGPLKDENGQLLDDDLDQANLLNRTYAAAFTVAVSLSIIWLLLLVCCC